MHVQSTCDKGEKTCPRYATGSLGPLQAGPGNLEFLKLFWPEIGLALEYGKDFVRVFIKGVFVVPLFLCTLFMMCFNCFCLHVFAQLIFKQTDAVVFPFVLANNARKSKHVVV